jgi:hypothetical protein
MGRSFLSVKLAFVFGVCVAVLVLVHDRARAGGDVPDAAVEAVSEAAATVVVDEADAADTAAVCLWRGCPATSSHPRARWLRST